MSYKIQPSRPQAGLSKGVHHAQHCALRQISRICCHNSSKQAFHGRVRAASIQNPVVNTDGGLLRNVCTAESTESSRCCQICSDRHQHWPAPSPRVCRMGLCKLRTPCGTYKGTASSALYVWVHALLWCLCAHPALSVAHSLHSNIAHLSQEPLMHVTMTCRCDVIQGR